MLVLNKQDMNHIKAGGDPPTDNHGFVVQVRQES
jgi:hypothetical protein